MPGTQRHETAFIVVETLLGQDGEEFPELNFSFFFSKAAVQGRAERRPCAPAPAKPPPEIAGSEPPMAPPAWEPNKGARSSNWSY